MNGILLKTIAIVIAIVSHPEFLLFKVEGLIDFGKAITPENHEIFEPASKSGYPNIWREDSFKKFGKFPAVFVLVAFYEGIPTFFTKSPTPSKSDTLSYHFTRIQFVIYGMVCAQGAT